MKYTTGFWKFDAEKKHIILPNGSRLEFHDIRDGQNVLGDAHLICTAARIFELSTEVINLIESGPLAFARGKIGELSQLLKLMEKM